MSRDPPSLRLPSPYAPVIWAVNRALAQDESLAATLLPFAGKVARVTLLPFVISIRVTEAGLIEHCQNSEPAWVAIDMPMASGLSMIGGISPTSGMRIEGDAAFAEALATLSRNLRPDVEEDLSRVIGDIAAVRVVRFAHAFGRALIEAQKRLTANVAEYLVHENPQLVDRHALSSFTEAVRLLRDDLARLEKRVTRLKTS